MRGKSENKGRALPLILLLLLFCGFVVASYKVNAITTEACFRSLDEAASQFARDVRHTVERNEESLEIIASMLAHDEMQQDEVQWHITSFPHKGTLTDLAVLFTDGTVLYSGSGYESWGETLDFASEAKKVPYHSTIYSMGETKDKQFVYKAIPILIDGGLKGILYGIVRLDHFSEHFTVEAFQGVSEQYVIEAKSGKLLMDTWHDKLGNMYDGTMARPVKEGYDGDNWTDNIRRGEKCHLVSYSKKAGEAFYIYSVPVGVNDWAVMLTVPESAVFAESIQVQYVLYVMGAFDIVILVCYFFYVLSRARKESRNKEEKLQQTLYMYEMQQILFDAHKEPERVIHALEQMAKRLTAETAFLCPVEGEQIGELYRWPEKIEEEKDMIREPNLHVALPTISEKLQRGESVFYDINRKGLEPEGADRETFSRHKTQNLVMVPVHDSDGRLIGVLGGQNMTRSPEGAETVESVARSFMMALRNISSYQMIERLGTIDTLTGLKNRNSFELVMEEYAGRSNYDFGCIYIDVNGLHELNNEKGHAAGDEMLRFVGENLKKSFAPENVYRIGGDEFVAFFEQQTEDEIARKVAAIQEQMKEQNYHLSVGEAWRMNYSSVNAMVSAAEKCMYAVKRRYYENRGDIVRSRVSREEKKE